MIFELAMGDLTYRQIGVKYGKSENTVKQFAWYHKGEIARIKEQFHAELALRRQVAVEG